MIFKVQNDLYSFLQIKPLPVADAVAGQVQLGASHFRIFDVFYSKACRENVKAFSGRKKC